MNDCQTEPSAQSNADDGGPVDREDVQRVKARRVGFNMQDNLTTDGNSRGLSSLFGIDPRAATLTVLVDLLLFSGDVCTLGALIPVATVVAIALGFICYGIQTRWAKDDPHSALIKAGIIALLSAIPVPVAPVLAIPSGVIGLVQSLRRR